MTDIKGEIIINFGSSCRDVEFRMFRVIGSRLQCRLDIKVDTVF